jgi:hypothetical protein
MGGLITLLAALKDRDQVASFPNISVNVALFGNYWKNGGSLLVPKNFNLIFPNCEIFLPLNLIVHLG